MCYKTMIGIYNQSDRINVEKVCRDIANKDVTFKFKIVNPGTTELREKFNAVLIIRSLNEEIANKRGGWFIHKVKDARIANYFWVKPCKSTKK